MIDRIVSNPIPILLIVTIIAFKKLDFKLKIILEIMFIFRKNLMKAIWFWLKNNLI